MNCDKGAVPMQLVATPKKHNIYGLPIATESDNVPLVNIPCFGVCSINNSPCIPVAPEWKGVHGGAQKVLGKAPFLLSTSYCKCQKGGSIKIFLTKKDAEAALADDKKSRVDGIPWLDDAIGNALLGPVGMVANKFFGSDDISQGVGRGFRKGLKGTLNFFTDDIWKADTWKGMGKMAGVAIVGYGGPIVLPMTPEKRLKAFDETFGTDLNSTHDAIGAAITQTWDEKVVNGTNAERSELAGQTAEMVFEAVLGSKGAGVVTKGTMAGAKMALGAERFTEITAAIAKLRQAVKLESLLNKVKGIFKVGEVKSAKKMILIQAEEDVIWSADLDKSKSVTRSGHRNAANKQLNEAMKEDPILRSKIEKYDPNAFEKTELSIKDGNKTATRKNPENLEWDHNNNNKNQIDLKTKEDHLKKTVNDGQKGGGFKKNWKK